MLVCLIKFTRICPRKHLSNFFLAKLINDQIFLPPVQQTLAFITLCHSLVEGCVSHLRDQWAKWKLTMLRMEGEDRVSMSGCLRSGVYIEGIPRPAETMWSTVDAVPQQDDRNKYRNTVLQPWITDRPNPAARSKHLQTFSILMLLSGFAGICQVMPSFVGWRWVLATSFGGTWSKANEVWSSTWFFHGMGVSPQQAFYIWCRGSFWAHKHQEHHW